MNLDESECLGCVYIFPSENYEVDAEAYMWVRHSQFEKGLDQILYDTVRNWITKVWPFKNVLYPGRE
jgi:hypothetical protein